ncbi:hypothetical protein FA95DRAFT_1507106, partial [Auriscalpium vulgare]
ERLHIDFAKDAYRATNKKDYVEQMIWWLERHDKVAMFDVHVRWLLGELPSTKPARRPLPRTISIAKKPNSARVPFTVLSRSHHAPDFPSALQQYIGSISKTAERPRRRGQHSFEDLVLPFKIVDVWHRIKFSLPNLQLDTSPSFNNTVIAQPSSSTASERFDTVLVDERGEAGDAGVAGLRVGRIRVIFCIPPDIELAFRKAHGLLQPIGTLVYIEWFTRFDGKDINTNMYPISKLSDRSTGPRASVLSVSALRRGVQLVPKFDHRANRTWTAQNVLDKCDSFFVNNFTDHHAYQSIW